MARKSKIRKTQDHDRLERAMKFARALNFNSLEAYQEWCILQGFSIELDKSKGQLEREMQRFVLKKHKREGNTRNIIQKIYSRQIKYRDLNNEILKIISDGFKRINNKKLLLDVLLSLEEKTKLLNYEDYTRGVISFVFDFHLWLRPYGQWEQKSRNAGRQFSSLSRFLFAKYEVPIFMDRVWQKDEKVPKGWFIHIGQGKNIRFAKSLPIKMTKKMAHSFLQAPDSYSVNAAFRWAQVHALGGNKAIADAVVATRLSRAFNDDDFWLGVIRFFIANPMLDTNQYNPIIDYIWNQKYENRIVFIERGVAREEGPIQPNFSMQGRTPDTLLRQVENWHRRLGRETKGGILQWCKSKTPDFRFVEGRANTHNMKIWSIRELLNSKELIAEGRKMNHCVASYARSCMSGGTSIWTMGMQDSQEMFKILTIEVHNPSRTIRQIRGLRNRLATKYETSIIKRWSQQEDLALSSHLNI